MPVPFNDAGAMERRIDRLAAEGRLPACLIMEAAMMNLGVVLPEPGYLEAVRELTARHGIVLIFDEVKTGLTVAPGGAVEYFGVLPDLVTLAKTLGAGLPSGAIGGSDEVMACVEDGRVYQVGTYNGNPLSMAAARASLLEVLTPDAYAHLHRLNDRLLEGCGAVVDEYRLPGYAVGIGAKGCVTFSPVRVVDYETFKAHQDVELTELAWLWNLNRGIFATPGREEEWTLSVQHTDEAVDRYVSVFEELARELTRRPEANSGSNQGHSGLPLRRRRRPWGHERTHSRAAGRPAPRAQRFRPHARGRLRGPRALFRHPPRVLPGRLRRPRADRRRGHPDLPRGCARHPGRGQGRLDRLGGAPRASGPPAVR